MFKRILSSAVAVASLAAATPALAENHDHSRNAQSRAAETCPCCAATDEASGGQASLAANEDPLDRSMDAGG